ncbi:hypothetical protein V1478_013381 [Vespula squamosa]|uniref:Uncharacterized protein n=1 Tax=Vespula squamosa TaxID=30214 RepID=A0ABD2AB83_VESSQ
MLRLVTRTKPVLKPIPVGSSFPSKEERRKEVFTRYIPSIKDRKYIVGIRSKYASELEAQNSELTLINANSKFIGFLNYACIHLLYDNFEKTMGTGHLKFTTLSKCRRYIILNRRFDMENLNDVTKEKAYNQSRVWDFSYEVFNGIPEILIGFSMKFRFVFIQAVSPNTVEISYELEKKRIYESCSIATVRLRAWSKSTRDAATFLYALRILDRENDIRTHTRVTYSENRGETFNNFVASFVSIHPSSSFAKNEVRGDELCGHRKGVGGGGGGGWGIADGIGWVKGRGQDSETVFYRATPSPLYKKGKRILFISISIPLDPLSIRGISVHESLLLESARNKRRRKDDEREEVKSDAVTLCAYNCRVHLPALRKDVPFGRTLQLLERFETREVGRRTLDDVDDDDDDDDDEDEDAARSSSERLRDASGPRNCSHFSLITRHPPLRRRDDAARGKLLKVDFDFMGACQLNTSSMTVRNMRFVSHFTIRFKKFFLPSLATGVWILKFAPRPRVTLQEKLRESNATDADDNDDDDDDDSSIITTTIAATATSSSNSSSSVIVQGSRIEQNTLRTSIPHRCEACELKARGSPCVE